jgi:hypothetical protein
LFVDPGHGFFQLNWSSPCIDAGLPDSLDPDGTVSDIGAFYFHQGEIIIDMRPVGAPISVPAGGHFNYHGFLGNNANQQRTTDFWIMLYSPGIGTYGPLLQYDDINLLPNQQVVVRGIRQNVPGFAPAGFYTYLAYCGDYPDDVTDSAFFGFDITLHPADGSDGWDLTGWFVDAGDKTDAIPATIALFSNYPNPFNSSTEIIFSVPSPMPVKLDIFNLMGQKVATLVDGHSDAGRHSVNWNASSLSSGIYFYKLTAGDKIITKRMTLLK